MDVYPINQLAPGQVITFYSYKGGVGRSMALANVACVLAKSLSGERGVLVVDWDLEAPGLHRFFGKHLKKHFGGLTPTEQMIDEQPGLLDLFVELNEATKNTSFPQIRQNEDIAQEIISQFDLQKYVIQTDVPNLVLLKAGRRDKDYATRVNTFPWEELYNRSPYLYRTLAEQWAEEYEFVLIDSRTGETDTGGICTMIMPEKLVVVFAPNRQSTIGVLNLSEKALNYRQKSDDLRHMSIFPLPSRIEMSAEDLQKDWRKNPEYGYQPMFERLFQKELEEYFNEVQIQHHPSYSYGEEIAVLNELSDERLSLSRSYYDFTNILVSRHLPWEEGRQSPYVFISYAQTDRAIAEKVAAFLQAARVRVFLDSSDIGAGDDWAMAIDKARRECRQMVLLLSEASMPSRRELDSEWIYFTQQGKPIYPLYLRDCEINYRLKTYSYIDARSNLQEALDLLLDNLGRNFNLLDPATNAEQVGAFKSKESQEDKLTESLQILLKSVRSGSKAFVELTSDQIRTIKDHNPTNLTEYYLVCIAEWSLPRYELDKRFVNLTLLLDKGEYEAQRWHKAEDFRFNNLREILDKTADYPALVLLAAPGSGKSTLLRRLQLDHSQEQLKNDGDQISFFIPLNSYRATSKGELPEPREWLSRRWAEMYPQLGPLELYLQAGRALLLLDALNEMPHQSTKDYFRLVGLWRAFAQEAVQQGNRLIFTCRTLDYSASLSSKELRVPQIEAQPMTGEQVRQFLEAYTPMHAAQVWRELEGTPQFSLFQTPYFLKLLCEQVEASGDVPTGRATLFNGFVRQVLQRELEGELFQPGALLDERDHYKLLTRNWRNKFELPERGALLPKLSELAFSMQLKEVKAESAQVRIDYDDACYLLAHEHANDILKAGVALNVLDEGQGEILFFHQLLQEYFAARRLAKEPNPELVHVEWSVEKVSPTLAETFTGLADGDPLPPLPHTGWEETTLTAAPMAKDPQAFIRNLIPHNLPLAAHCAASPELSISSELKRELQQALIARTQDASADLRARIAASEALGLLGDPRFKQSTGPQGNYLLPPLVEIPGGMYPLGDDKSDYDDEKPAHKVQLAPFQISQFPVTNAEYALFMKAGGYEDERWWDTAEALAWLRGERSAEGSKQQWRDNRRTFQDWSEDYIRGLVKQNRITSQQADDWIEIRNWTDERFEQQLEEWYPAGKLYRQPEYWNDTRFNNPAQPVVGVTWFEAHAYCNWLTANVAKGPIFRLPTEAEFEAAARGKQGRLFPYGNIFDVSRSNTFESHIRRTTPIGIFDNATPEGVFDLSGNAYTWTVSAFDQGRFPYPYRSDDGRENVIATGVRRTLRGGSWFDFQLNARAAYRQSHWPASRAIYIGFRVVVTHPLS